MSAGLKKKLWEALGGEITADPKNLRVEVTFNGEGDNGAYESFKLIQKSFVRKGETKEVDLSTDGVQFEGFSIQALNEVLDAILPEFWNGEGGFGTVTIDLRRKRAYYDFHVRTVQVVDKGEHEIK